MPVSNQDILKTILLQELDRMEPETSTFEDDPMQFILKKYVGLKNTLEYLMTPSFEEYITGIYVVAPKPTTFKIVLHNGQFFFLQFMGKAYEATVEGKKYYLMSIGEKERCMIAISRLLRFGNPLKTKGPEGAEQGTRDSEGPDEEAGPTPPAETSAPEEGGEELTESRILENVLKNSILQEGSRLTANDLAKPSRDGNGTRGDFLLRKIQAGEKIQMTDGQSIIIDKKKSSEFVKALEDKKYRSITPIRFYDKSGFKHNLTQLSKTEEFGAGKGSGGGASATAVQESSQCLVNAIRYNKGSEISESDLTDKNFAKATKRISTTSSLEEMVTFIKQNPSWKTSLISTANALAATFPGNYKFYRGAGVASTIDKAAKSSFKYVIGNLNINKWNPSDIWMATDDLDIDSIPFDNEPGKLNKWMVSKFKAKQLIGVSLKKCSGDCKLEVYNLKQTKRSEKFEGIDPKDKNFFKTKDVYVNFTGGKIQFRNFSDITSWQGEIKSKTAAGGKIGGRVISSTLFLSGALGRLPDQTEVLDICSNPEQSDIKDLYKKYKNISLIKGKIKETEFSEFFLKAPLGNKTSNYMNIYLLYYLSDLSEQERNDFIQSIVGYSKSESNLSSVFVKAS